MYHTHMFHSVKYTCTIHTCFKHIEKTKTNWQWVSDNTGYREMLATNRMGEGSHQHIVLDVPTFYIIRHSLYMVWRDNSCFIHSQHIHLYMYTYDYVLVGCICHNTVKPLIRRILLSLQKCPCIGGVPSSCSSEGHQPVHVKWKK